MAQTVTTCPRCRHEMTANIQQVFDLNQDPTCKERLLSGQVNLAVCPSCGYQSPVGIPLVYHDPEKELLLTYFPAELGLPISEQEKILGPLINQVVNNLPMEARKGYLLQPQSMLTYDTLLEKILAADGITKEMLQEQEQKITLLRRLLTCADESIPEIITQEKEMFDQSFFALFSNLQASAAQSDDEKSIAKMKLIQDVLLRETTYGQALKKRAESTQKALLDLQNLGEGLNQDSLLELALNAPDDAYLQTITGLARSGMDYDFFTKLTAKIDGAEGETKTRYEGIREKLLASIQQIDAALVEQKQLRKQVFDAIMKEENMEQGILKYAQAIDSAFLETVEEELAAARKNGDFMLSGKIQSLLDTIKKISEAPPEIEFLEELIEIDDPAKLTATIDANREKVTDQFKQTLDAFIAEIGKMPEQQGDVLEKLNLIRKIASM